MTTHEHVHPCRPCREGRHCECVPVRAYGEDGYCRYVCRCDHRSTPDAR